MPPQTPTSSNPINHAMSGFSLNQATYRAGSKIILQAPPLQINPGEITAVIGPSGSGKSTLLKLLATVWSPTTGSVHFQGQDLKDSRSEFRMKLGYAPQDDVIHTDLTVEDSFRFAAELRLPGWVDAEMAQRRIDAVIQGLGLEDRRGHRIAKLSGGQRKRVNVGVELLADPEALLMDEAASGLDPATEGDLMKLLVDIARQGKTVVLTTHSMEYLDQAHKIVLLSQGLLIFAGNLSELLVHFNIPHIAEVFKKIREREVGFWHTRYISSALAVRQSPYR